ncbi:MAG: DNA-3-methyladenine glycosylase [Bryobacteraceae bacterium]|nr:DNA-3-methyladenine glycosylase [Bryobacteraceae bacterium]
MSKGRDLLPRSFYERSTPDVARDLLGKVLRHGPASGIIVETEAYLGADDLAAHSSRGITERTKVIFGEPGHVYVYLIYGMYECLNIVAEPKGIPGCVLIRALEPRAGIELMRQRRPRSRKDENLASGPGKLTQALGISREHNGTDLLQGPVSVHEGEGNKPEIVTTPRIGISKCADWPLRFYIQGNRFVSRI